MFENGNKGNLQLQPHRSRGGQTFIIGVYGLLHIFQAAACPAQVPGLASGRTQRPRNRDGVDRHHVGGQYQPRALSVVGEAFWSTEHGGVGPNPPLHPQDGSFCGLRWREPGLLLQLAANPLPHGRKALDALAPGFGSGGGMYAHHCQP